MQPSKAIGKTIISLERGLSRFRKDQTAKCTKWSLASGTINSPRCLGTKLVTRLMMVDPWKPSPKFSSSKGLTNTKTTLTVHLPWKEICTTNLIIFPTRSSTFCNNSHWQTSSQLQIIKIIWNLYMTFKIQFKRVTSLKALMTTSSCSRIQTITPAKPRSSYRSSQKLAFYPMLISLSQLTSIIGNSFPTKTLLLATSNWRRSKPLFSNSFHSKITFWTRTRSAKARTSSNLTKTRVCKNLRCSRTQWPATCIPTPTPTAPKTKAPRCSRISTKR